VEISHHEDYHEEIIEDDNYDKDNNDVPSTQLHAYNNISTTIF